MWQRASPAVLLLGGYSSSVLGCGEILDADAYAVADEGGQQKSSVYTPACKDCLDVSCRDVVDTCNADEECGQLLACIQTCSDPGCVTRCSAPSYGPFRDWPIDDVEKCLLGRCREACPAGETFACADYSWASPYDRDDRVAVDVRVFELAVGFEAGLSDVTVTPCVANDFGEACNAALAQTTDQDGIAQLDLTMNTSGFPGFFAASDPQAPSIQYRAFREFPFNSYWDLNQFGIDRSGIGRQLYEEATRRAFGPGVGALFLELYDCNTWPSHGLVVDVTPSDDAWIFYPSAKGHTVGEGIRDDNGDLVNTNNFVVIVAPPGDYELEVRTVEGELVRHARLPIVDEHFDGHWLFPEQR